MLRPGWVVQMGLGPTFQGGVPHLKRQLHTLSGFLGLSAEALLCEAPCPEEGGTVPLEPSIP